MHTALYFFGSATTVDLAEPWLVPLLMPPVRHNLPHGAGIPIPLHLRTYAVPAVTASDILDLYPPPLDVGANMLFVATSTALGPLRESFPGVPFLALSNRVPLVLWFSRVHSLEYGPVDSRQLLDESGGFGYNELNVVALLRSRKIFVPAIYATGDLTQRLGHRYGMPKSEVEMSFAAEEEGVTSSAAFEAGPSEVNAQLLASGRILGRPFEWATPWWTWPARFPSGTSVRAEVLRVPQAQLAAVDGMLRLDEPWLPAPARLWRLGMFVPGFRMRLPPPVDI